MIVDRIVPQIGILMMSRMMNDWILITYSIIDNPHSGNVRGHEARIEVNGMPIYGPSGGRHDTLDGQDVRSCDII